MTGPTVIGIAMRLENDEMLRVTSLRARRQTFMMRDPKASTMT